MEPIFSQRGFLPTDDPLRAFPHGSEWSVLDELGGDLPSLLEDSSFRRYLGEFTIPPWTEVAMREQTLAQARLYYLRLGFLASAYVNQVSQPRATVLPRNISIPLTSICRLLKRPPVLSYAGYALYNWKRFNPGKPVALGNIDTLQNFVHRYDEHWFILVHVEIEALAGRILAAIGQIRPALGRNDPSSVNRSLGEIAQAVWQQVDVLRRIPEKMDPAIYYRTFRPYIRFFENVVYEGVDETPLNFRGETGAQSSIMPTLVALMKIDHRQSVLTDHLSQMQRFMPAAHRDLIEQVRQMPSIRGLADKETYNELLEAMATFRKVHYGWAQEYINQWTDDPRGTGGTPYMKWLSQLIEETRAQQIS